MELQNQTFRVENFTYENEILMETMFKHLEETNFLGVSVSCVSYSIYIQRECSCQDYNTCNGCTN